MFEVRPLSKFDFAFSRLLRSLSWPFEFNHTERVHFDDVESEKRKKSNSARVSKGYRKDFSVHVIKCPNVFV